MKCFFPSSFHSAVGDEMVAVAGADPLMAILVHGAVGHDPHVTGTITGPHIQVVIRIDVMTIAHHRPATMVPVTTLIHMAPRPGHPLSVRMRIDTAAGTMGMVAANRRPRITRPVPAAVGTESDHVRTHPAVSTPLTIERRRQQQ